MHQLHQLITELTRDTLGDGQTAGSLWPAFAPELLLCATIVALLLIRVCNAQRKIGPIPVALVGTLLALCFAGPIKYLAGPAILEPRELFTGMLIYDTFAVYMRSLLLLFVLLLIVFTRITNVPERAEATDFLVLLLGATLGMCLMASANHLLIVFLAVEMASVPSYVLAGMLRNRRQSSEAALKYSVYGAGAAGVMLYGISLLAGMLDSAHLPTMAVRLAEVLPECGPQQTMVLVLGGLMLAVGLAFKLSAVPFHFWCPDVFEGATAEINAFLSVASKAAAMALLVRVALGFAVVPTHAVEPAADVAGVHAGATAVVFYSVSDDPHAPGESAAASMPSTGDRDTWNAALAPARKFIGLLVALIAVITCTLGNLAAYAQTNMKRLMAYSTIAHAGYMMMAIPAAVELAGADRGGAQAAIAALALYLGVYLFMNLGVFALVAVWRNLLGSEEIDDYGGLLRHCPAMVVCLAILLFSLVGLPPLAGFVGKFAVFAALVDGYRATGSGYLMVLLVVGGVNTVISLFYYLRVVKVAAMSPEPDGRVPFAFHDVSVPGMYVALVTAPMIVLFLLWGPLNAWTLQAAGGLF